MKCRLLNISYWKSIPSSQSWVFCVALRSLSLHQAGFQVNSWKVSGRSVSLWPVWICACGVRMAILAGVATQHWLSFLRATLYKHIIRSRLWGCICGKIKKPEEGREKSPIVSEGICLQPPSAEEFNFADLTAAITGFKLIFLLLDPKTVHVKNNPRKNTAAGNFFLMTGFNRLLSYLRRREE